MTADSLAELLALYRLVHADEIVAAKQRILGEGTRAAIYDECVSPQSQTELSRSLGVAQPTISSHLRFLVDAGLLTVEREGRTNRYIQQL